jgi:hypothetical protein
VGSLVLWQFIMTVGCWVEAMLSSSEATKQVVDAWRPVTRITQGDWVVGSVVKL